MVLGTRQTIRSKQIDAYGRQRSQHNIPKPPNYRGKWKPWQWQHDPGADQPTETYNFWDWGQVTPEASPSQKLKEQFERGQPTRNPTRVIPDWTYRPKPKEEEPKRFPLPTPPEVDEPPGPGDLDDLIEQPEVPWHPIEDTPESDDEGESREQLDLRTTKPRYSVYPQCAVTELEHKVFGVPYCSSGNAPLQIRSPKKAFIRSYGKTRKANRKSSNRYYPF